MYFYVGFILVLSLSTWLTFLVLLSTRLMHNHTNIIRKKHRGLIHIGIILYLSFWGIINLVGVDDAYIIPKNFKDVQK